MRITIVGAGYVGFSLAATLSKKNNVIIHDIDDKKIAKINQNKSPITDPLINKFIKENKIKLKASIDKNVSFENAEFVIIATPTNYDEVTNYLYLKKFRYIIPIKSWKTGIYNGFIL